MRSERGDFARSWALRSGLTIAGVLLGLFAALTLAAIGPLESVDVALNGRRNLRPWRDELMAIDRIGQRAVCLTLLAVVTALVAYRVRSWRPVLVAALSVLSVNLLVLVLKLSLGRGLPELKDPSFFNGGSIYPSGHSANVVLVYGVSAYLLLRYRVVSPTARWRLTTVVVALSLVMVGTSLALRWHWFTDLLGGLLVGAAVLVAAVALDCHIPWREGPPPRAATPGGATAAVPSKPR